MKKNDGQRFGPVKKQEPYFIPQQPASDQNIEMRPESTIDQVKMELTEEDRKWLADLNVRAH